MRPKYKKLNNKGLSLVEVIIAVFMLAILAMPIINTFVASTQYLTIADNLGNTTYLAQSVMEDLYPVTKYSDLYTYAPLPGASPANYQIKSVVNSSTVYVTKKITIDRIPYGSFNDLVSGTACYAHLIINGSTATLTTPDGVTHTGLSYSSGVSFSATTVTLGGNTYNLNKPSGSKLILIINARTSSIPSLTISLPSDKSVPYVLYGLSDITAQVISVSNGATNSREYRKFNASTDLPPDSMLVNVICKVYSTTGSLESIVQDTLKESLS